MLLILSFAESSDASEPIFAQEQSGRRMGYGTAKS
jgi:hypothetical protein